MSRNLGGTARTAVRTGLLMLGIMVAVTQAGAVVKKGDKVSMELPRLGFTRGEQVPIKIGCPAQGTIQLTLQSEESANVADRTLVDEFTAQPEFTSTLDTRIVPAGHYELAATLTDDAGKIVDATAVDISIVAPRRPGVRLGMFGMPTGPGAEKELARWAALGCDHVFIHHNNSLSTAEFQQMLETGYRYGISVIPILNTYLAPLYDDKLERRLPDSELNAPSWAQILSPSGQVALSAWKYPYAALRNEHVRDQMRKYVTKVVDQGKGFPGFEMICLDDEFGMQLDWRGGGMGDFSPSMVSFFKEKTGLEPPAPTYVPPGYIAEENDPFLAWTRLVGSPGYESPSMVYHNTDLAQTAHGIDLDLKIAQMPGAYDGELDVVIPEVYTYGYREPELQATFTMDLMRAMERGKDKPVWPLLGWYGDNSFVPYTANHLKLLAEQLLAKGAASIDLAPSSAMKHEVIFNTYAQIADEVHRFGPMTRNLSPIKMPVAVLYSDTTRAYQQCLKWEEAKQRWDKTKTWFEEPWEQDHSFSIAYPALLRAHLPVTVITEADVQAGDLKNYDAVILVDFKYSTHDIMDRLNEYVKQGGKVFADRSSVLRPEGAIEIPCDFSLWSQMIPLGLRNTDPEAAKIVHDRQDGLIRECVIALRRVVVPQVKSLVDIDNEDIVYSVAHNGDTTNLFLFNVDLWQPAKSTVTIHGPVDTLYDVQTHKRVDAKVTGDLTRFDVNLEPGGWAVYAVSPREITQLRMNVAQAARQLKVELIVAGEGGLRISGSNPLQVDIFDAAGHKTPYSGFYATDHGRLSLDFDLARREATGQWKIVVTDLVSGTTGERTFPVL